MPTTTAKAKGIVESKTGKAASPKTRTAKKKKEKEDVNEEPGRCEGILCPAAMDNLYYIAHDAADALRLRGFYWRKSTGGTRGRKVKN